MPAQLIRPEDKRISPISIKVAQTTGAGAVDGSTIVDSAMAGANGTDGLYAVINPANPLTAVVRQISGTPDGAGAMTLSSAFPAQVGGAVEYAIVNLGVGAGGAGVNAVAVADAVANITMNQAVGNKADAVQQAVAATRSLMGYVKALKTNQGDPSGHTLISWALKWGNNAQSFAAWAGDMSGHALTSIAAKWGNMTETLLVVLGARADVAVQTTADASMHARLKGLLTSLGNPAADTLVSITAKLGNLPVTVSAILGNPTADTLTSLTAKWGNNAQSFAVWAGDMSGHALTSIAAKWGNMTETLLVVLGARADVAVQTTADASMHARLKGLLTSLGNPTADTLTSLAAKWGNNAVSLATKTEPVRVSATFSYLDAGGEQTVFTVAPPAGQTWEVSFFALDINSLTQNNTIRTKKRIDGASFRTIASALVLSTDEGAFDTGAIVVDNTSQLQVTMQEVADEAAARAIPYEYYYRRLI